MVLTTKNGGAKSPTSNKEMKKYLILRDTVANQQKVKAGEIVELDGETAYQLLAYKKAELYKEQPKPKRTNRSVGLKSSDILKPKKRSKK